jgi:hypothetical protein
MEKRLKARETTARLADREGCKRGLLGGSRPPTAPISESNPYFCLENPKILLIMDLSCPALRTPFQTGDKGGTNCQGYFRNIEIKALA